MHARKLLLSVRSLLEKNHWAQKLLHTEAWDTDAFTPKSLYKILCTTKLAQSTSQYYFVLQSLHKALPITTLYYKAWHKVILGSALCKLCSTPSYKACTKHFPALLCTTKLAQSTPQHYFVLQSLHKALPSTTLYQLARSTSHHYVVLHSWHKALPSTTLYYKACTKHFPALLCTTKLAQSTLQYYFALQSLHKALPSTPLYSKACTKHFPVLLRTTRPGTSTSQYYYVLRSLHKALPSTTLYGKCFVQAL